MTSLPNLHPAIVHFPIALWSVAVLGNAVSLALRRHAWLERASVALYTLAAVAAGAAYLSGRRAADGLEDVPALAQMAMAEHSDSALRTLVVLASVALAQLVVACWSGSRPAARVRPMRIGVLAGAVVGLGLVTWTADLGGALVYRHGLAVFTSPVAGAKGEQGSAPGEPEGSSPAGPRRTKEGGLMWSPVPRDASVLFEVLEPMAGVPSDVVEPVSDVRPGSGVALYIRGRELLLLPEEYADVQVEAVLELAGYQGRVGLVHHCGNPETMELFWVSTSGETALLRLEEGKPVTLDQEKVSASTARMELAVSAAGSHIKGMLGGKTIVHGHGRPGKPGRAGLFFDGEGRLRLIEIRVIPLDGS